MYTPQQANAAQLPRHVLVLYYSSDAESRVLRASGVSISAGIAEGAASLKIAGPMQIDLTKTPKWGMIPL